MSYSRGILAACERVISERRSEAERAQAQRIEEVKEKLPGYGALQAKLASTAADAIRALSAGENAPALMKEISERNLSAQKEIEDMLEKGGFPRNYTKIAYTCPKCSDTGYAGGNSCSCRLALLKELALENLAERTPSGKCSFQNFKLDYYPDEYDERIGCSPRDRMAKIFEYCKAYADDFDSESESLYFYGATGLGKTHLLSSIARVVTEKGNNIIFESASALLRRLEKERFSNGRNSDYDGAFDEIVKCDLLIIDDLGSEFSTQFTVSALYDILNYRVNRDMPVIISSNLSPKEVEENYNQRIFSRIFGGFTSMYFVGNDIRQIKKNS
jgi:DNA replication protein DnaC